jgi:competence protein ComEC
MASVGAVGLAIGRRGAAGNALGAAVTAMLMIDPRALEDVGFLLSVTATAGLVLWQRELAERLAGLPSPLAEGLAATLAASLPTIPIVAAFFGRVSLVSPVANLVAVPLFAPILLFGAATSLVGAVLPWAAGAIAAAAYVSAAALRHSVELFARVPLASAEVPALPLTGLVLAVLLAVLAKIAPAALVVAGRFIEGRAPRLRRPSLRTGAISLPRPGRPAVIALCLAVVVGSALAAQALPRSSSLRVRALDVGQGDAFLLESAGRYALIDGGPDPSRLLRELGEALPPWDRRIDVVILTHEHADHGNGLLAVLDRYDVRLAVEPLGMSDVPLVRSWSERIAREGVRRVALGAGARLRLGRVTLHVLAPGRDRRPSVANLVLLAEAPEGSVLFMGDATDDAIADLLLAPDDLAARVYVPPHHGADTLHAAALLEAVRPEAALLSVGASNRYGHPTPGTLAALAAIPVYRTDRHGTVEVELDGDRIHVRTDKAGVPAGGGGPVPSPAAAR